MAKHPPVRNPAMIELYGSSFFRTPFTAQSNVLNIPPQTPKLPAVTGARALMAVTIPILRSPYGEFRKPLMPCHKLPPLFFMSVPVLVEVRSGRHTLLPLRTRHRNLIMSPTDMGLLSGPSFATTVLLPAPLALSFMRARGTRCDLELSPL